MMTESPTHETAFEEQVQESRRMAKSGKASLAVFSGWMISTSLPQFVFPVPNAAIPSLSVFGATSSFGNTKGSGEA